MHCPLEGISATNTDIHPKLNLPAHCHTKQNLRLLFSYRGFCVAGKIKFDCTVYYVTKVLGLVTVANLILGIKTRRHPTHLLSPSSSNATSLGRNPID